MKKISQRKLALSYETVRVLSGPILKGVRGGQQDMSVHYTLCVSDGCDPDTSPAECDIWSVTCTATGTTAC